MEGIRVEDIKTGYPSSVKKTTRINQTITYLNTWRSVDYECECEYPELLRICIRADPYILHEPSRSKLFLWQ
jgi:hypothetical protein